MLVDQHALSGKDLVRNRLVAWLKVLDLLFAQRDAVGLLRPIDRGIPRRLMDFGRRGLVRCCLFTHFRLL